MPKTAQRDLRQRDALTSPRFAQIASFARLPHSQDLTDVDAAFIGVPFDDGTTFRSGARMGPAAIRENSRLLRPYNPFVGVSPFDVLNVLDYGDVDVVPGYIPETFTAIEEAMGPVVRSRVIPLIGGGDHSITLPILRQVVQAHGPVNLLHFDSHLDFWDEYWGKKYTHGTWLRRVVEEGLVKRVGQAGIRGSQYAPDDMQFAHDNDIRVVFMDTMQLDGVGRTMETLMGEFPADEPLYISWDIDVVDPAFAGATGTPEVGGLTSWQAVQIVRSFVNRRIVGMDIVEVAPPYDGPGAQTSLLAANLFYEMISVIAKSAENGIHAYR